MAHPLELAYQWQTPVVVSTVGLVAFVGLVARSRAEGWVAVVALLIGVWGLFLGVVWLRTRAYVEVDGSALVVRRYRSFARIEGSAVTAVQQIHTPHGPCYRLTASQPSVAGGPVRQVVPVALLRRGHATFFRWLAEAAPQAELDKGSRRMREELRRRELIT